MGPPLTWGGQFGARWWLAGQAMWPVGRVEWLPPTRAFPPRVDVWQPSLGPNRLKLWPAGRPLGAFGLVRTWSMCQIHYVVMMILTFGQLHFVIR
jgi:hypothetical protein